jgi:hypothetical protein
MLRPLLIAALLLAVGAFGSVHAQGGLGTAFTYQGELRSAGTPATGNHDFEFRLFDAATGGAQIGPNVALNSVLVQDGLFSVALDFGDQFTGARRYLAISVRTTGQPGFTTLAPRQELLPAPYAQHAEFVSDNSIVGANIIDGSVGSADLAASSVTTTRIANGAVTADKLAPGVIGELSLIDGSVTTPKLASQAVTTPKIAAGAVTAAKIADGAVGLAQINTNQVQARIGGSCPAGQPLLGVDASGGLKCDRAVTQITGIDLGPNGSFIGLAVRDSGRPVAAYINASSELVVMACYDVLCNDRTFNVISGVVAGRKPVAVALRSNGRPFIAYSGASDLMIYDCANDQCSSGTRLVFPRNSGSVAMVIRADDRPLIANYDDVAGDLLLHDCQDQGCTTISTRTLDSAGVTGSAPSMIIRNGGRPMIAYRDVTNSDLRVYDCSNTNCTAGVSRMLDSLGSVGARSSIAQNSAGEIVITYQDLASEDLKLFHCSLPTCDLGNPADGQAQTLASTDSVGLYSKVLIRSGDLPLVLFWNETSNDLKAYDCTNNRCQFGTERTVEGSLGRSVGRFVNAALRGGLPLVAYNDDDAQAFKLLGCGNEACINP